MTLPSFVPLSRLLETGRAADYPVGYRGRALVTWHEFQSQVARYAAELARRHEKKWLLISNEPLTFAAQLMALAHADKLAIIPPNLLPGTLANMQGAFDAVLDFQPGHETAILGRLDPAVPWLVLYSSGSTGKPKAIPKNMRQFEAELSALEWQFGAQFGHCPVFGSAPHHHLYGLTFRVLWPLSSGRPTDNETCSHPEMVLERLSVLRDGVLVSSPAQLSRWPDLMPLDQMPLKPRRVISAGGPLSEKTANTIDREWGFTPIEIYGSSETGGIAWRSQDQSDLWTPLPSVRIQVGANQALKVHSPLIDDDHSCQLEDAVEIFPDGRFKLKGRLDRTVKLEEKRLFLPDMEALLLSHPGIENAVLVLLAGDRCTLGAVAALSTQGHDQLARMGRRAFVESLKTHLRQHFDPVLIPRRWRFPQRLPFNERGKLPSSDLAHLFDHEN